MNPGDIISYMDMCQKEGINLQRGMNFHLQNFCSVILMSVRLGAPYADRIEDDGKILIYEGHDASRRDAKNPKRVDQPMKNPGGSLTQNGLFYEAALKFKNKQADSEKVRVYEKIKAGIWAYNGIFRLTDSWIEKVGQRSVFKFRLELTDQTDISSAEKIDLEHNRLIPTHVKIDVWKRDGGQCVLCGSADNLHFDHDIPFSKGGTSISSKNIKLLCARHNLNKSDRIQ